ncbi:MAG: hypothetical protein GY868_20105 [Deltaproteobacteria bacterium]|nr:hypothetical protein [Deltaproteobacteria bacterium]
MKKMFTVVVSLVLMASVSWAHIGIQEERESSFWRPIVLEDPALSTTIYGYLYPYDIDLVEFEIAPAMQPIMDGSIPPQIIGWEPIMIPLEVPVLDADGKIVMDYTQTPPRPLTTPVLNEYGAPVMAPLAAEQVLLNPAANVPACTSYTGVYPSVAIEGPGLPGHDADDDDGLLMGFNRPEPAGAERPIYTVSADEMNVEIAEANEEGCNITPLDEGDDLSMFIPYGLTQECLHCSPWTCDQSNTATWYTVYAGTYKFWIFNTSGTSSDYVFSQGIEEELDCEGLRTATELMRSAVSGDLYREDNCINAGNSGFTGCGAPPYPY